VRRWEAMDGARELRAVAVLEVRGVLASELEMMKTGWIFRLPNPKAIRTMARVSGWIGVGLLLALTMTGALSPGGPAAGRSGGSTSSGSSAGCGNARSTSSGSSAACGNASSGRASSGGSYGSAGCGAGRI